MDFVQLMQSLSLGNSAGNSSEQLSFYKAIGVKINEVHTDIIYADHENKLLIIASQYQKFGALLSVTKEQVVNFGSEPIYVVKPIFGSEDLEQQAAARFIAEKLNINKPLSIFLCLDHYQPEIIRALVDVLLDIKKSA